MANAVTENSIRICDGYEEYDDGYIATLSQRSGWFSELRKQPQLSQIDYTGRNSKGEPLALELKCRDRKFKDYSTIFIEFPKYQNLMGLWEKMGMIPVYINFFGDADELSVWDLRNVKYTPSMVGSVRLWNAAYQEMRVEKRMHLPHSQARHYRWDEENKRYKRIW